MFPGKEKQYDQKKDPDKRKNEIKHAQVKCAAFLFSPCKNNVMEKIDILKPGRIDGRNEIDHKMLSKSNVFMAISPGKERLKFVLVVVNQF